MCLKLPGIPLAHALAQIGKVCDREVSLEIFNAKPELVDTSVDILYTAYSEMMKLEAEASTSDPNDIRNAESMIINLFMLTLDMCSEVGLVYTLIYRLKLHAFVIDQITSDTPPPARIMKYLVDVLQNMCIICPEEVCDFIDYSLVMRTGALNGARLLATVNPPLNNQ